MDPPRQERDQESVSYLYKQARKPSEGAAIEIINRVDGEAADREAARLRTVSG